MRGMPMIYTGLIFTYDGADEYLAGIDLTAKHRFKLTGFWTAYGNRKISSYALCDEHGEALPEYEHLQFSRDRHNHFYLETVN